MARFNLSQPVQQIAIARFGGLFTEADPRDLPSGASWLAQDVDFLIAGVGLRPGLSKAATFSQTPGFFQYVKSALLGNTNYNLAQDTLGNLWDQVIASGGNYAPFYSGILNGARALSFSANLREYICLSNLVQGTDQPRQYDGTNLDRISQVGPGISPTITPVTGGPTTDVAAGTRYGMLMFLTRTGALSPASPPVQFTTTTLDTGLTLSNLCVGPANVLSRVFAWTSANAAIGGPYWYVPVADLNPSGNLASSSIIADNTSTTVTLNISDTVLQAGINVSGVTVGGQPVTGNNQFSVRELGEPVKGLQYSGRTFFMGCRNKIDQFVNLTFDGGSTASNPVAGWTITKQSGVTVDLMTSPIFGQSLYFKNGNASYINSALAPNTLPPNYLSQTAYQTVFNTSILVQDRQYGLRVTMWSPGGNSSGSAQIGFYSSTAATLWTATVNFGQLTKTPQEFVLPLNNPAWATIPTDLELVVFPVDLPPGADFAIDRMEIYDLEQPVLSSQIVVSYAENPEAFDGVTGLIDISNYTTDPIKNIFRFLNTVYIATGSRWFSTQDNGTTEPDGWTINEVSNAVGCLGPLCEDVGEEYVITGDLRGIFIFDGGSHVKLSQEIQQLWESIAWQYQAQTWIRNDRHQQRLFIGTAIPQPTLWSDLPTANPTAPNVILLCSYLTLAPGSSIAMTPGVMVSSFTGQLLNREGARKWALWSIPANYADWIQTADGGEELILCSGKSGNLYLLDSTVDTDDGAAIPQQYGTFGFSDHQDEEMMQLGSVRKLYPYASILMDVTGKFILTAYPETPQTPYSFVFPALAGSNPALDDLNLPLNISGNRVFLKFATDGKVGSYYNLRRLVLGCMLHPRLSVSGRVR